MKRIREKRLSKYSTATLIKHGANADTIEILEGTRHLRQYLRQFERRATQSQRAFSTRNVVFQKRKRVRGTYHSHNLIGSKLAVAMREVNIDITDDDLVYIKAPKGNGKTEYYASIISSLPEDDRAVALVHRRSLARALSSRLSLSCYLDEEDFQDRFVISLDSLTRFDIEKDKPYDTILIDESEQVFRHLLGSTTEEYRGKIFRVLTWLIRNAKKIICADADITGELTCYVVAKLRSSFEQDNVVSIVNKWPSNRSIDVYEKRSHLIAELLADIYAGKRVYVPVGRLDLANNINSILREIKDFEGNTITSLMLTGDTSEDEEAQEFFKNPNEQATKYQVLISTSTLSTGVSIDVKWFDAVYGIFDHGIYTYQDCDQAISRVRNREVVKVWIHNGAAFPFGSEEQIRSGSIKKEVMTRGFSIPDANGKLSEGDELYMDIAARIEWCERQWSCNREQQFVDLKNRRWLDS